MVEIKLSQGAKPGHGGLLPGAKVSAEIAETRDVPEGCDCLSPACHSAFSTPRELVEFAARLRDLAGGKPVGIKLCVGYPHELFAVVKAMLASGIHLDFIVIDGAEGGTGAAPKELSDSVGMPLREGLIIARNALVGTGLRDGSSSPPRARSSSGAAIAMNAALGADWCNAARAFMFSLGCVQSMRCHTDTCPTGVATQSKARQRGLVVAGQGAARRQFPPGDAARAARDGGRRGLETRRTISGPGICASGSTSPRCGRWTKSIRSWRRARCSPAGWIRRRRSAAGGATRIRIRSAGGPGREFSPRSSPGRSPEGENWCGREDSNFHGLSATATSTLRVYQFRHDRT